MDLQRRSTGSTLLALASVALCAACGGSEPSAENTSAGSPTGSGAASGTVGTTGSVESTSDASTTGAVGTTGTSDTSGTVSTTGAVSTTTGADGTTGSGGASTTGAGGAVGDGGATTVGVGGSSGGTGMGGSDAGSVGGTSGGGTMDDAAPSSGCGSPAGLEGGRASIDVNGKMREYILYIPDNYDPNQAYRLIFGWHPWGGSAAQTEQMGYFGLESVSNGQAILVAPEGQDYQDNGLGWGNENGEDLDFMHAMVDRFSSELCIDQNRIFSTGFSFGAMFSFTLACSQDGLMRAIAPQAGNPTTSGPCEDGPRSVATMAFIGTEDTLLSGHRQGVQIFVERNGCSTEPVQLETSWCDGLDSQYEPCMCVEYPDCNDGFPVIECEYNAGHTFAPNSGQTIWDFFSQF